MAAALLEAARNVYEGLSPLTEKEVIYQWSVRLLHASKLASPSEARTAHEEHLERMESLQKIAKLMKERGRVSSKELNVLEYYATEARLWLLSLE